MSALRIVLVAKSPLSRSLIQRLLCKLPKVEILGEATSLAEATSMIEAMRPDLAVLGPSFATSGDFRRMHALFGTVRCRWIEIAGLHTNADADADGLVRDSRHLPVLLHGMTQTQAEKALSEVMAAPIHWTIPEDFTSTPLQSVAFERGQAEPTNRFILFGASTGGVDALLQILGEFPEDCPPTAIVQHTGRFQSGSLIQLLSQRCRAKVVAPRDGMELHRGMVTVAAGGQAHLKIAAGSALRCHLRQGTPVSGHMPSVDALFTSAVPWADRAVAVILTGMGSDGAQGLNELRRAGATTIGQDEATSLVYGMPKAAWNLGAVQSRLALSDIAGAVLNASQVGSVK